MGSPSPSNSTPPSSLSNSSESELNCFDSLSRCGACGGPLVLPKVLTCFHAFCRPCLERLEESRRIICPSCRVETFVSNEGVSGLLPYFGSNGGIRNSGALVNGNPTLSCTGCRSADENGVVAHCRNCSALLCSGCELAHRFMRCFDGHCVRTVDDAARSALSAAPRTVSCVRHGVDLEFVCRSCDIVLCTECVSPEHVTHDLCRIDDVSSAEMASLQVLVSRANGRASDLRTATNAIMQLSGQLRCRYEAARTAIIEAYNFFCSAVEDRKQQMMRELDMAYNDRQVALGAAAHDTENMASILNRASTFVENFLTQASAADAVMFRKTLDLRISAAISRVPDLSRASASNGLDFVADYPSMQAAVRNAFGLLRVDGRVLPDGRGSEPVVSGLPTGHLNDSSATLVEPSLSRKSSLTPPDSAKWNQNGSCGSPPDIFAMADMFTLGPGADGSVSQSSSSNRSSQVPRQKMVYHCKFGEFGSQISQFTEPSGVAVNSDGDILVADTNNHRIQVFDRDGVFKFHFGACGKHDGQLLYPNRVAVCRITGDIIVTERSPTHQVQIFTHDGAFVRKFGATVLQHPRGVTVDFRGRIVVVECKVMRVVVFDRYGTVLHKFGCSRHLEFPNGVVANDQDEIFISDNRSHCVKVFGYDGAFLRQIGGEGVTNYPIGVGIDSMGRILVADNHNNFNATLFTSDGRLVTALESRVKHAQCFDVALADDGSVILASKDFRVYIYRYAVATSGSAEGQTPATVTSQPQLDFLSW